MILLANVYTLPRQCLYVHLMEVKTECYQVVDKEVKVQSNSGAIYVPKSWVGKKVRVLLLEPLTGPDEPGVDRGGR